MALLSWLRSKEKSNQNELVILQKRVSELGKKINMLKKKHMMSSSIIEEINDLQKEIEQVMRNQVLGKQTFDRNIPEEKLTKDRSAFHLLLKKLHQLKQKIAIKTEEKEMKYSNGIAESTIYEKCEEIELLAIKNQYYNLSYG